MGGCSSSVQPVSLPADPKGRADGTHVPTTLGPDELGSRTNGHEPDRVNLLLNIHGSLQAHLRNKGIQAMHPTEVHRLHQMGVLYTHAQIPANAYVDSHMGDMVPGPDPLVPRVNVHGHMLGQQRTMQLNGVQAPLIAQMQGVQGPYTGKQPIYFHNAPPAGAYQDPSDPGLTYGFQTTGMYVAETDKPMSEPVSPGSDRNSKQLRSKSMGASLAPANNANGIGNANGLTLPQQQQLLQQHHSQPLAQQVPQNHGLQAPNRQQAHDVLHPLPNPRIQQVRAPQNGHVSLPDSVDVSSSGSPSLGPLINGPAANRPFPPVMLPVVDRNAARINKLEHMLATQPLPLAGAPAFRPRTGVEETLKHCSAPAVCVPATFEEADAPVVTIRGQSVKLVLYDWRPPPVSQLLDTAAHRSQKSLAVPGQIPQGQLLLPQQLPMVIERPLQPLAFASAHHQLTVPGSIGHHR